MNIKIDLFLKKKKFDGTIKSVHFYQNISIVKKGESVNYFYKDTKKITFIDKLKKIISLINK